MTQNLAIVAPSVNWGHLAPARAIELHKPGEGELLIKVVATAQNPVDAFHADTGWIVPFYPNVPGYDGAGTVAAVGAGVSGFAVHYRVAWMRPSGENGYGTYQQYCLAKVSGTVHLPSTLSLDDAATLPLAYFTAAVGVYTLLGVPLPLDEAGKVAPVVAGEWFLVWGANSPAGAAAVQLAKAAGFQVIATSNQENFAYVKSLGTDVILDYDDLDVVDKIQAIASLSLAFDAISQPSTSAACIAVLSSAGAAGKLAVVRPLSGTAPDNVAVQHVLARDADPFSPGHEHELEGLTRLWQALVSEGRLRPYPVHAMPLGLNSVDKGIELQKREQVRAQTLVYHPQFTQG
ncbi:NAD(P)-binding protein [Calocera viscosa TUFC12733]|uniref:NAD(P)-binding protein n=1 Tax=Calocera viscosa (strain TUFC12733) TaxID=1330018 RepID=A0A167MU80_CALVF|nr:NAD(P)-binding protein [Calocera viscosa TUFC12733]